MARMYLAGRVYDTRDGRDITNTSQGKSMIRDISPRGKDLLTRNRKNTKYTLENNKAIEPYFA